MKSVKNSFVGKHGPLLIAEIGGNHEGDFNSALRLTDLAIESGVDVVKFQLYSGDGLVNKVLSPDRNLHFKKFELSKFQHVELAKKVTDSGLIYMASVWDLDMLDWVDSYMPVYKIGSGDLTAYPIIEEFAKREKPIILSTGLSSEEEVLSSVKFLQGINQKYCSEDFLALLQCTSMYPIALSDANLNVIKRLRELTGLTVGYSDHTIGYDALLTAYSVGAQILEFHFTDQREGKEFRDHKVSLVKEEVHSLIKKIEDITWLLGEELKNPLSIEIDNGHLISFRRGVFLNRNMKEGEIITRQDLVALRPNIGISASNFDLLIGKKLNQDTAAYSPLSFNNFISEA